MAKRKSQTKSAQAKAGKLPYEVTVAIGDWSEDGHNQSTDVTFGTSHSANSLKDAYLKAVQETGLTFDHDHPGIQICTEFEEHALNDEVKGKLLKLGFNMQSIADPDYVTPEEFASLILWFSGRNLPGFQYEIKAGSSKSKTYLNGYWDKKLNVQFGYGLFSP